MHQTKGSSLAPGGTKYANRASSYETTNVLGRRKNPNKLSINLDNASPADDNDYIPSLYAQNTVNPYRKTSTVMRQVDVSNQVTTRTVPLERNYQP